MIVRLKHDITHDSHLWTSVGSEIYSHGKVANGEVYDRCTNT
jgi:hypothetical protein